MLAHSAPGLILTYSACLILSWISAIAAIAGSASAFRRKRWVKPFAFTSLVLGFIATGLVAQTEAWSLAYFISVTPMVLGGIVLLAEYS